MIVLVDTTIWSLALRRRAQSLNDQEHVILRTRPGFHMSEQIRTEALERRRRAEPDSRQEVPGRDLVPVSFAEDGEVPEGASGEEGEGRPSVALELLGGDDTEIAQEQENLSNRSWFRRGGMSPLRELGSIARG